MPTMDATQQKYSECAEGEDDARCEKRRQERGGGRGEQRTEKRGDS